MNRKAQLATKEQDLHPGMNSPDSFDVCGFWDAGTINPGRLNC
jgi:hypothetical protein